MKKSIKAALLSGLVFPGLGQFMLKSHKRGTAIVVVVMTCLYLTISEAIEQAHVVLEKLEQSGGAINIETITNATTQASATTESNASLFINLIIICWVVAIVDAYITGKTLDKMTKPDNKL